MEGGWDDIVGFMIHTVMVILLTICNISYNPIITFTTTLSEKRFELLLGKAKGR